MAKKCSKGCDLPVFSKGLCLTHWKAEYGKPIKKTIPTEFKARAPINKKSAKQTKRAREYGKIRKVWMEDHTVCQALLPGCLHDATEVHHMRGREGDLLMDTDTWLVVCTPCHTWITENSGEAICRGLSLRRNVPLEEEVEFYPD